MAPAATKRVHGTCNSLLILGCLGVGLGFRPLGFRGIGFRVSGFRGLGFRGLGFRV